MQPFHFPLHTGKQSGVSPVFKSTPVGPVAGGIMGCFLILALGVYCYRHHVHRSGSHHYMQNNHDNQLRVSTADDDNDVDDLDSPEELGAGREGGGEEGTCTVKNNYNK